MTIYPGPQVGEEHEVTLRGLSYGGDGVGAIDGLTVFVPRGLPGERHRVRLTYRKKKYAKSISLGCLESSARRRPAPCPHFSVCGGCHTQHMDEAWALEAKLQQATELLRRIGKIAQPKLEAPVASPLAMHYRNKMTLHRRGGAQGYTRFSDYGIEDISDCLTVTPQLQGLWTELKPLLAPISNEAVPFITLRHTGADHLAVIATTPCPKEVSSQLVEVAKHLTEGQLRTLSLGLSIMEKEGHSRFATYQHLYGPEILEERVGDQVFSVYPDSFFQANPSVAKLMLDHVLATVKACQPTSVLDLYCGVGFFSLPLARTGYRVYGIESHYRSIQAATHRAQREGLTTVEFRTGKVEKLFRKLRVAGIGASCVVVDPPRSGLEPDVAPALKAMGMKDLIYVSCVPSSLARDMDQLRQLGYELVSLTPFDLFPQTYHIELIAHLRQVVT